MHVRRSYLEAIEPFIGKPVIKVIVGLRRSGKSTLIQQLRTYLVQTRDVQEHEILSIDKEDVHFDFIRTYKDLHDYVGARNPKIVMIDEVQEIESWEKAIASFQKRGLDVYITGSNAKMLASDLATLLAGRYVSIPVFTLSYAEFIQFHQHADFAKYLQLGGFPVLAEFSGNQAACYTIIKDIFETIVLKDIVSRHQVRRVSMLHNVIRYVADNIGNTFSAHKVSEYLKSQRIGMDVETVQNYLQHLVSAFVLHRVRRFDLRGKRHLEISEKYYLGDLGLRHALIGYQPGGIAQFLENIVYIELLRRGYQISVGKLGDREVDFIAERQSKRTYIQVCYLLSSTEVIEREFGVLRDIPDQYPKMVLSMDPESFGSNFDGIERHNLVEWILKA